ncbi:hypothetical protein AVEN_274894-1 [Araneus ventricosus]|uniref:Uncharacterized protein n=1 Tax=Araneus ventricosus TaxID=182803 RepID=A0A4Y2DEF4_ARAVE|nr:hypothetical protein AVEN_274894-1 [Araneus ventricosus]
MRNNDHRKPIDAPLYRAKNYRFNDFPIHERHPTVIHLSVHLENGQRVYFKTGKAAYVPKHLMKQRSYFSSDSAPKMSFHAPCYTMKYPSTTFLTMKTRYGNVEHKGRLY